MLTKTLPIHLSVDQHPQSEACARCTVREHALFGALRPDSLDHISVPIGAPHFKAEQRIFAGHDQGHAVYTLRAGIVRFERVTEDGHRRIVRLAGRGDLIGQEALLGLAYRDDAVACTPVDLCRLPVAMVETLSTSLPELMQELMRRWQLALDHAAGWTAELSAGAAQRRLLKLLQVLQRVEDDEGLIWLPRRDQIGDMLDMSVETASRIISKLRREAVIDLVPPAHARLHAGALRQALKLANA